MLVSFGVFADDSPPRVLDLYAGSGALGLEALSRGATAVVLVESSKAALAAIRQNVSALDVATDVTVLGLRVDRALAQIEGPFDLVLMDPPYAEVQAPGFGDVLEKAAGLVGPSGVLVLEHDSSDEPAAPTGLVLDRRRKHGDTTLSLFVKPAGQDGQDGRDEQEERADARDDAD